MRAARGRAKVGSFAAPRNLKYTTRANISHEEAEQIRARIVCTPAYKGGRGLTHMRSMCVGVAETGHRGSDVCADGMKVPFFILAAGYAWALSSRGDHWSPAKKHKDTFLLSYF